MPQGELQRRCRQRHVERVAHRFQRADALENRLGGWSIVVAKRTLTEKLNATLNAYYSYQNKVNYTLTGDPATVQKAYGVVNIAAGLAGFNNGYKSGLFVNNLFDKQYYTRIDNRASLFGGATAVAGYLPRDFRRYGDVRVNFSY